MLYPILLTTHVLAATVWTGGHLVLALTILPKVLKHGAIDELKRFESGYERIGIPALLIQVATGLWLALRLVPEPAEWLRFETPIARMVGLKLLLLLATLALAADARLRIIPKLSTDNLRSLAGHVLAVTTISVLFVIVGVSFRMGGLF